MVRFLGALPDPEERRRGLLDRMTDSLAHRGPDDRGTWLDGDVALGARRLAVIDPTPAGHQPMLSEDGAVALVYNGEVYNFRELARRHRLRERGHVFRSRTDTEVLLHLWEVLGVEMLAELNGQFALAVWERRTRTLYLARDRYGIKPLFWQRDGDRVRFASEIKAILEDDRVPRRVDLQAMHDFLTLGYVPGTRTAFRDVSELAPGHWMRIGVDGVTRVERYWELPHEEDPTLDGGAVVERASTLMARAVERRLVADRPLGVLLSGGMDSSTLVALMHEAGHRPLRTYSVGFEDPTFDERGAARTVARHFGAEHREVVVTAADVRAALPGYLRWIDEPYADGSAIPTWHVSALAREDVVVLLSGEGGDEAFAGYDTHAAYKAARLARRVPRLVRHRIVAPLVARLPVSHGKLSLEFRMKRFLGGLDLDPVEAHLWWRVVLTEAEKRALYAPRALEEMEPEAPVRHFRTAFDRAEGSGELNRLLHVDASVFLPDDLMIKNDRMTMAHSLEARVPFTDPDLTGWMARVPASIKMPGMSKKHVMRRAMEGRLPPHILRRKKVGLELPYSRWLADELRDVVHDYLGAARLDSVGLFRPEVVQRLIDEHTARAQDHGRPLWALLNFMMWHELYIP